MIRLQSPFRRGMLIAATLLALGLGASPATSAALTLRYGHMNSPSSVAGQQAQMFADKVKEYTNGEIEIQVYPSSQLGKMQEMAEATSTGVIALSHNTAGGTGSLYEPFAALDTPYLYRDVKHLMQVTSIDSPVMKKLNEGLIEAAGVRVLYAYYFGTRNLTANKAVRTPADLAGVKIRALPFPIYMTAVEALGAVPVPVDWSEVPTALATGQVSGQENPVDVVLSNKLYESQSHLMLTGHIMNPEVIIMNNRTWEKLTDAQREAFKRAANETRAKATEMVQSQEADQLAKLKALKMTVIGPEQGLDLEAFRANASKLVKERFADKYGDLYKQIADIK
ncbi:TRAP transporter substrate-binding protein [Allopusillimonas soli]|uniref:TRAP transporter substrate-binding protein n=1 Tax=Allopusillimonas soli TaxID=659016 RepID=A0A853FFL9_9BURK|nr:TRAP transporter substrate-binding protein [Allopusillimonas soli]NYT38669.1 TRAP transporter substrate-binding protein [Allopusillimonas soli]TEA71625.1 TRAP transporter substrate-binding protein [Allopusillimonas soli]